MAVQKIFTVPLQFSMQKNFRRGSESLGPPSSLRLWQKVWLKNSQILSYFLLAYTRFDFLFFTKRKWKLNLRNFFLLIDKSFAFFLAITNFYPRVKAAIFYSTISHLIKKIKVLTLITSMKFINLFFTINHTFVLKLEKRRKKKKEKKKKLWYSIQ